MNVVLDICQPRPGYAPAALRALSKCRRAGGRMWLYSGSVQTLEYTLVRGLLDNASLAGSALSRPEAHRRARRLLEMFARDKQWLAALSAEGDVFAANDPEHEQLLRALDRFPPRSIRLLTRDETLLARGDARVVSPQAYLQASTAEPLGEAEGRAPGGYDTPAAGSRDVPARPIPFIDLQTQQDALRPQLETRIHRVLHHGQYIMGGEVRELEERLAAYVGVEHCITASSGTDTLLIALMALGVGPGDEVVTTPFTFIATGEMIALLGAKPVFADIDPRTCNLAPAKIEAAITSKTRAIMPVSLYGQCADMDAINAIAEQRGLAVIEDGAQSFGATYKGRRSCGLSTIGSTSFFPSKPLGGYGDGGALFTSDDQLAKAMREIRVHGQDRRYHHARIGINGRLDTLQAAVVLAKLARFDEEVGLRQAVAAHYADRLCSRWPDEGESAPIRVPYIEPHNTSVFAQYTVSVADRPAVVDRLRAAGIPTAIHYPVPLHLQPAFATWGYRSGDFPVAEDAAQSVLSLPMSPDLQPADQDRVVAALLS